MTRKVIVDCDPGIDDAVALTMALFDPALEVVAINAVAGNVRAHQATLNVQAVIEQLDPPRFPRVGAASEPEGGSAVDARHIHGRDGLGNAGFAISQLHHQHPADKLIADEVRAAPNEVTIICLGPLTNVARAIQRDPEITQLIDRLVIMGGTLRGEGNVTPAAEFNIYVDPDSAKTVFNSPITKCLVPIEVTRAVSFSVGLLEQLPPEQSRAGQFLRKILPPLFRSFHQQLGREVVYLHDAVALMAVVAPELFEMRDMAGDVETRGELTTGATVFDRREKAQWRNNMEVAKRVDVEKVRDAIVRSLTRAGTQSM